MPPFLSSSSISCILERRRIPWRITYPCIKPLNSSRWKRSSWFVAVSKAMVIASMSQPALRRKKPSDNSENKVILSNYVHSFSKCCRFDFCYFLGFVFLFSFMFWNFNKRWCSLGLLVISCQILELFGILLLIYYRLFPVFWRFCHSL